MTSEAPRPALSVWMRCYRPVYGDSAQLYRHGAFSRMMPMILHRYTANALGNPLPPRASGRHMVGPLHQFFSSRGPLPRLNLLSMSF